MSSSSSEELYAVAGSRRRKWVSILSLIRFLDFCLVPIGTGPDPSVRRPKTTHKLISPTTFGKGRRVHRRVSACARKIRIEVQGIYTPHCPFLYPADPEPSYSEPDAFHSLALHGLTALTIHQADTEQISVTLLHCRFVPFRLFTCHSEGPWHDVTKAIHDCHAAVHAKGAPRIATDVRIGTRVDINITPGEGNNHKVARVLEILARDDVS